MTWIVPAPHIDDTIAGDRAMAEQIETCKESFTSAVFASRGYHIDQPLALIPQDPMGCCAPD